MPNAAALVASAAAASWAVWRACLRKAAAARKLVWLVERALLSGDVESAGTMISRSDMGPDDERLRCVVARVARGMLSDTSVPVGKLRRLLELLRSQLGMHPPHAEFLARAGAGELQSLPETPLFRMGLIANARRLTPVGSAEQERLLDGELAGGWQARMDSAWLQLYIAFTRGGVEEGDVDFLRSAAWNSGVDRTVREELAEFIQVIGLMKRGREKKAYSLMDYFAWNASIIKAIADDNLCLAHVLLRDRDILESLPTVSDRVISYVKECLRSCCETSYRAPLLISLMSEMTR